MAVLQGILLLRISIPQKEHVSRKNPNVIMKQIKQSVAEPTVTSRRCNSHNLTSYPPSFWGPRAALRSDHISKLSIEREPDSTQVSETAFFPSIAIHYSSNTWPSSVDSVSFVSLELCFLWRLFDVELVVDLALLFRVSNIIQALVWRIYESLH